MRLLFVSLLAAPLWASTITVTPEPDHHASKKHLGQYVDEFTWRLNEENVARHTLQRLDSLVDAVVDKRITYAEVTA